MRILFIVMLTLTLTGCMSTPKKNWRNEPFKGVQQLADGSKILWDIPGTYKVSNSRRLSPHGVGTAIHANAAETIIQVFTGEVVRGEQYSGTVKLYQSKEDYENDRWVKLLKITDDERYFQQKHNGQLYEFRGQFKYDSPKSYTIEMAKNYRPTKGQFFIDGQLISDGEHVLSDNWELPLEDWDISQNLIIKSGSALVDGTYVISDRGIDYGKKQGKTYIRKVSDFYPALKGLKAKPSEAFYHQFDTVKFDLVSLPAQWCWVTNKDSPLYGFNYKIPSMVEFTSSTSNERLVGVFNKQSLSQSPSNDSRRCPDIVLDILNMQSSGSTQPVSLTQIADDFAFSLYFDGTRVQQVVARELQSQTQMHQFGFRLQPNQQHYTFFDTLVDKNAAAEEISGACHQIATHQGSPVYIYAGCNTPNAQKAVSVTDDYGLTFFNGQFNEKGFVSGTQSLITIRLFSKEIVQEINYAQRWRKGEPHSGQHISQIAYYSLKDGDSSSEQYTLYDGYYVNGKRHGNALCAVENKYGSKDKYRYEDCDYVNGKRVDDVALKRAELMRCRQIIQRSMDYDAEIAKNTEEAIEKIDLYAERLSEGFKEVIDDMDDDGHTYSLELTVGNLERLVKNYDEQLVPVKRRFDSKEDDISGFIDTNSQLNCGADDSIFRDYKRFNRQGYSMATKRMGQVSPLRSTLRAMSKDLSAAKARDEAASKAQWSNMISNAFNNSGMQQVIDNQRTTNAIVLETSRRIEVEKIKKQQQQMKAQLEQRRKAMALQKQRSERVQAAATKRRQHELSVSKKTAITTSSDTAVASANTTHVASANTRGSGNATGAGHANGSGNAKASTVAFKPVTLSLVNSGYSTDGQCGSKEPCRGRYQKSNFKVGQCNIKQIEVWFSLGFFSDEPTRSVNYQWQQGDNTPKNCLPSNFDVVIEFTSGNSRAYMDGNNTAPSAERKAHIGGSGSPDWDELFCGYNGNKKTTCLNEEDARAFFKGAKPVGFKMLLQ